jgi:hypothetical protein
MGMYRRDSVCRAVGEHKHQASARHDQRFEPGAYLRTERDALLDAMVLPILFDASEGEARRRTMRQVRDCRT